MQVDLNPVSMKAFYLMHLVDHEPAGHQFWAIPKDFMTPVILARFNCTPAQFKMRFSQHVAQFAALWSDAGNFFVQVPGNKIRVDHQIFDSSPMKNFPGFGDFITIRGFLATPQLNQLMQH